MLKTVLIVLAAAIGLVGATMTSYAAPPGTAVEPASCGQATVVRDYLKPLDRLPKISNPPASGTLPFGPKGLKLRAVRGGLIVGRGGRIGFALGDEAIQQTRRLNWIVETRLARVDSRGVVTAHLGTRRRSLGTVRGGDIGGFLRQLPGNPAFYRMDIRFRQSGSQRLLGEYSTYTRVMRPRVELRVVSERSPVHAGEFARAKLVNLGTVGIRSVSYDYGFRVEAFTGEKWIPMVESPQRGRVPKRMQILSAGTENRGCLRYRVPADQAPGLFRFVGGGPKGEELAAEFQVVPGPPILLR